MSKRLIKISIDTKEDYVNIYELQQIREWWEKLSKPKLFNAPRIRLWNLWYEFLYMIGWVN